MCTRGCDVALGPHGSATWTARERLCGAKVTRGRIIFIELI